MTNKFQTYKDNIINLFIENNVFYNIDNDWLSPQNNFIELYKQLIHYFYNSDLKVVRLLKDNGLINNTNKKYFERHILNIFYFHKLGLDNMYYDLTEEDFINLRNEFKFLFPEIENIYNTELKECRVKIVIQNFFEYFDY